MKIQNETLSFGVKLPGDADWTEIKIEISDLRRQDFTCDESVSIDIMEYVYAENERFYEQEEELEFNVENYWNDIAVPTHRYLYQ